MIETAVTTIIAWVHTLGFMGVFYGSLLEEFFYIIPSSVVQLSAGAILLGGTTFSWLLVGKAILVIGLPASVGVVIGSLPYYALGYFGGKPAIERWGKWLGISWQAVEELDAKLSKTWWDDLIFIGLRALPILPSVLLSVGPGVLRMPLRTYLVGSFIGTLIRASVMGLVGALLGSQADSIARVVDKAQNIGLIFLAISCMVGVWFWYKSRKRRIKEK